jgi:putative transposase
MGALDRWSSCRYRLGHAQCEWLDHDLCYLALGANEAERRERYSEFLRAAIPDGEWSLIREAVQRGQLTGKDRFVEKVETIPGKRIDKRSRGRPPRPLQDSHELQIK